VNCSRRAPLPQSYYCLNRGAAPSLSLSLSLSLSILPLSLPLPFLPILLSPSVSCLRLFGSKEDSNFQEAATQGGPACGNTSYDIWPPSAYPCIAIRSILTCIYICIHTKKEIFIHLHIFTESDFLQQKKSTTKKNLLQFCKAEKEIANTTQDTHTEV
jgi:hypothetical protein